MDLNIMPNPAKEQFTVTSDRAINQIQMIDMLGKQVRIMNLNSSKSAIVDVRDLNKGVYTIIVFSVNGRNTSRVIVE